jgi:hypothetical protein
MPLFMNELTILLGFCLPYCRVTRKLIVVCIAWEIGGRRLPPGFKTFTRPHRHFSKRPSRAVRRDRAVDGGASDAYEPSNAETEHSDSDSVRVSWHSYSQSKPFVQSSS